MNIVPGRRGIPEDVALVYFEGPETTEKEISDVFLQIASERYPDDGGWGIVGCTLIIPDGKQFHCGKYRGSFAAEFVELFTQSANEVGREVAQIDHGDGALVRPDGQRVLLDDCDVWNY